MTQQFDARLIQRNARTNKIIDEVRRKAPTIVDRNVVDRVLRPFAHILNECELRDVEPVQVLDATLSVLATMLTEVMVRTIPRDNQTVLMHAVQDNYAVFGELFLTSVARNFNVNIETPDGNVIPAAPKMDS